METITLGHLLALAGLLDLLVALWFLLGWWRVREHGYGTPLYARGRTAKRSSLYAAISAILLIAVGLFTPLSEMAVL